MAMERTLSIIKPDACRRNLTGAINKMIEDAGLKIVAQRRCRLSREESAAFYAVHKERAFYGDLVEYMISGPVVVQVLEGDDAIKRYRELMGATNPGRAAEGTIRKKYGEGVEANSVHGSDAPETANTEVGFFFSGAELARLTGSPAYSRPEDEA